MNDRVMRLYINLPLAPLSSAACFDFKKTNHYARLHQQEQAGPGGATDFSVLDFSVATLGSPDHGFAVDCPDFGCGHPCPETR
jgi:hypothetical protein